MKLALFLLAFLWCFSEGNGGGSQPSPLSTHAIRLTSIRAPRLQFLKHRKLKPPNSNQSNHRLTMTDESIRHSNETEESLSKIWKETKYVSESTNPVTLKKKQLEKALNKIKEKMKNEENIKIFEEEDFFKFLKAKIGQKRDERPKFKRAQEARFSSGKIWVSPQFVDWEGKLNEEIVEKLFKNLPKMLKHVEVAEEAVNMVLVLDEINRPGDNVDERLKEGYERLNKANDFVNLLDEENQYRIEFEVGTENSKNLLNRAPGSVLDKYKVIDDKKVKNRKEIYIDKQPSIRVKEENWLEEASEDIRKEREKELKHVMKSEIFSGNTLLINKTVDWSKEYNANFVLEMLSRQSLPLPQETLEKLAVELVLVLDETQRVSDYDTEITKIENAIQEIKRSGKSIFESKDQLLNRAIVLVTLFDNFRGGATANEKKTEQITSQINVKKGFDEGEG
uniref:Uncharacterized protein n=1 Tax=Meloidogyne javanica TaxID=6303 RepID=A0A915MJP1_MELJA